MSDTDDFARQVAEAIEGIGDDEELRSLALDVLRRATAHRYAHYFTWLGRPIIQTPEDIVVMQEIVWRTRPELIVETGIARGGSAIFHASLMELTGADGKVIAIDTDIRAHNRRDIEAHPLYSRIELIEGSSTDAAVLERVRAEAAGRGRVMVVLDSNHTHEHVLAELHLYSPIVTKGAYLVVCDTAIESLPDDMWHDRAWGRGDNPMTAVRKFLETSDRFEVDHMLSQKLLMTANPSGHLRCIR